jgi:hypothetical protein
VEAEKIVLDDPLAKDQNEKGIATTTAAIIPDLITI